jgi:hypothetical protein
LLGAPICGFRSPLCYTPAIFAAFAFSSVQRRVHMGHAHSPVFSAPPVLIHISKPEKRLIDSRGLFVYSVNRFHFGTPFMPEICERLCELVIYILSADSAD